MVFLEYDLDASPGIRQSRWWATYTGGDIYLPLVIVDSGNQASNGYVSFTAVYSAMVDTALARPATAVITATAQRAGDTMHMEVTLTNNSGVALSTSNDATVHALVYEEGATLGVTDRWVHDAPSVSISPALADGATRGFILDSSELTGVDWDNIRVVVLADYLPGGGSGRYDTLQAAMAQMPTIFQDGFESGDTTAWSVAVE